MRSIKVIWGAYMPSMPLGRRPIRMDERRQPRPPISGSGRRIEDRNGSIGGRAAEGRPDRTPTSLCLFSWYRLIGPRLAIGRKTWQIQWIVIPIETVS